MAHSKLNSLSDGEFALDYLKRHQNLVGKTTIPYTEGPVLKYGYSGNVSMSMQIYGQSGYNESGLIADSDIGTMALGYRHLKLLSFWRDHYPLFTEHVDAPGRYWAMRNVDAGWRMFPEISPAALAEQLIRIAFPSDNPQNHQVFFNVTGGLAIKDAAHLARFMRPKKPAFIIFKNAFHGRVIPDLTSSNTIQRLHSPQSSAEVYEIPYPVDQNSYDIALKALLHIPHHVCALFVEGVQGEGGINVPDKNMLRSVINRIRSYFDNPLVIFDEVQTGLGRTGRWFSYEHYGILPDMVVVGKALGGSLPLSAVIAPSRDDVPAGMLGGTYAGGYPAAVAQAMVNLAIIEEEHLIQNAREMGDYLYNSLKDQIANARLHPEYTTYLPPQKDKLVIIHNGLGLMQGVNFKACNPRASEEWRDRAFTQMLNMNLFTSVAGVRGANHVIRIMPALTVTHLDIDILVRKFMQAVITSAPNYSSK